MDFDDLEVSTDKTVLSFSAECEKLLANVGDSSEARMLAVEQLCEKMAQEKSTIRRDEMVKLVSDLFGTKKAAIKSAISDIREAEKRRIKEEGAGLELQDGVDETEAIEFGIYEYKNRYWAIGKFGKYEISNFTIKVLFHIKTSDASAYRLIEIKNVYGGKATLYLNTDDFVSLGSFKKVIARFGNYIFKGADSDLGKLQEKIQRDEKPTRLVQTLGWNKRGNFYAFANGIVPCPIEPKGDEIPFLETDEYGIIENEDQIFFIPANSKIFEEKESQFTNDKKFVYAPSSHTNFEKWTAQLYRVYGEKAIIGTLFFVSSLFRDIIYHAIGRRFPILNLYGQRGSGKGTFMESYLWPFGKPQDQIMLGGASTVVGFMRKFAQFSNAFVWLDEYKNNLQVKILESLKNIYDGIGYERGKKDNTFETESIPINSACVLSGQEMPTAEPALFTRVIMLAFKPGKGFTTDDRIEFKKLQVMQEKMLSHITAGIVRQRAVFIEKYKAEFETTFSEIIQRTNNKEIDERMMLNIAVLATTYKVASTFLKFPYTYEQAEKFMIKNMKEQFTILAGSDDVAKWWQLVENLFTTKVIEEGRDFELDNGYLFLRIQQVHPLYLKELRSRNDPHWLDKPTLEHYLEMDAAIFSEKVKKRFSDGSNTWCYKFVYRNLGINLIRKGSGETEESVKHKEFMMGNVKKFKCRAQCEDDVKRCSSKSDNRIRIKDITALKDKLTDVEVEFESIMSLQELKAFFSSIEDCHVMSETVLNAEDYKSQIGDDLPF